MKRLFNFLAPALILFAISCNSGGSESMQTIPASTTKVILSVYPVQDFNNWRFIYLSNDSLRREYGISHYVAGQGIEDTSLVVVFDIIEDTTKLSEYTTLPEVQESLNRAGLIGEATVDLIQLVRDDSSATDITDRVLVKHKVKDFDAWLKVFDQEGMEKRKSYGLIDRGLGRGLNDPNMVYIVFAVSDWAKANERMNSEELKKLMQDAGVEGEPTSVKYTLKL